MNYTKKNFYMASALSIFLLAEGKALASDLTIPNTFSAGDTVSASQMNANFTATKNAVDDNASRITANESTVTSLSQSVNSLSTRTNEVESEITDLYQQVSQLSASPASTIQVDCDTDPEALISYEFTDNTTYVISGMCNGPVIVRGKANVTLQGDASGTLDDGISLPTGLQSDPSATLIISSSDNIHLNNIVITSFNSSDASNNPNGWWLTPLLVNRASSTDIHASKLQGGDSGIDVYENSVVRLYGNNVITGFLREGVNVHRGGSVQVREEISITSGNFTTPKPAVFRVYNNGVLLVKNATSSTFTPSNTSDSNNPRTVDAFDGGVVKLSDATITNQIWSQSSAVVTLYNSTVNDNIRAFDNGEVLVYSSTITDDISAENNSLIKASYSVLNDWIKSSSNSRVEMFSTSFSGTGFNVTNGSDFIVDNSSTIDISGSAYISKGGRFDMNDSSFASSSSDIQISRFGLVTLSGTVDLNGANITCTASEQFDDGGLAGINAGTISANCN